MTWLFWLLTVWGTFCSCVAIHYFFECRRLAAQQVWLRQALRERDAAGREPERIAFQSGYNVGVRVATGEEPGVECQCDSCRRRRIEERLVN